MNMNKLHRYHQSGFGLVELMVALAVGLILMAGVSQIYFSSKQAYKTSEELSRIQENARFAIIQLREDIRMAGYFGCGAGGNTASTGLSVTNNLTVDGGGNQQTAFGDFDVGITGQDDFDGGTSDYVQIVRGSNFGVKVTAQMTQHSADIFVTNNTELLPGNILLICDVAQGDIFQMSGPESGGTGPSVGVEHDTGDTYTPGNSNVTDPSCTGTGDDPHCLSKMYGPNAKIMKMVRVEYWVADGAAGTPALFRRGSGAAAGTAVELVEGVENMQIVYGIDTSGDYFVDQYVNATGVTDWDQVMSARVSLLFRSAQDNITMDQHAYTFDSDGDGVISVGEENQTETDNRLRQVYTTTINLRNRTLYF